MDLVRDGGPGYKQMQVGRAVWVGRLHLNMFTGTDGDGCLGGSPFSTVSSFSFQSALFTDLLRGLVLGNVTLQGFHRRS